MFKSFWNSIKNFFGNLGSTIKALFNPGYADSFDETRSRREALRNQSALNGSNYQDYGSDPSALYNYYNQMGEGALSSLSNKYTEAGITGQQAALNEMQMDNQRRQYAFNVQGMQEAGLNPALMYESGASSAPSAPAPTQGMSMSELIQAMLFDKQSKLLDAQARNTDADTDKKKAETENMSLINKYYPQVTETQIQKVLSDMGVNDETIRKMESEINLNDLEANLKSIDAIIRQAEANESSAYYRATRELQEAKTEEARNSAREKAADALMKEIEAEYEKNTNTKMSSSSLLAIASALGTIFGNSDDFSRWWHSNVYDPNKKYGWLVEKGVEIWDNIDAKRYGISGLSRHGGSRD